jgi:hypothetical protein
MPFADKLPTFETAKITFIFTAAFSSVPITVLTIWAGWALSFTFVNEII